MKYKDDPTYYGYPIVTRGITFPHFYYDIPAYQDDIDHYVKYGDNYGWYSYLVYPSASWEELS